MTNEERETIMQEIRLAVEAMLLEPSLKFRLDVEAVDVTDPSVDTHRRYAQGKGRTLTLKIHGGAEQQSIRSAIIDAFKAGFAAGFGITREGFNNGCAVDHLMPDTEKSKPHTLTATFEALPQLDAYRDEAASHYVAKERP